MTTSRTDICACANDGCILCDLCARYQLHLQLDDYSNHPYIKGDNHYCINFIKINKNENIRIKKNCTPELERIES